LSAAENPAAATETTATQTSVSNTPPAKQDLNALIVQAGKDFDDYQQLTAAGKLAQAGQKLEALSR